MKKILLYTVSDFKPYSTECIKLMISSFSNLNFEFKIVTSNHEYKEYEDVIFDDSENCYVGFLKYSKNIPSGYDQYVYLDSDILFFGEIDNLFSEKEYSCVVESLPMTNEWFLYKNHSEEHLKKIKQLNGFNAGTFCFKNISFLKKIRDAFEPYISQNIHSDARLEQSSFNFILSKEINFDITQAYDLTSLTQLFADANPYNEFKKLYHFCGFSNEMHSKFYKMKKFYDSIKK
jgi:lipopolysaccharide biosynthesis glycosyltransferase